jgi:eukaryotic-like serine/threonine-protein kinase
MSANAVQKIGKYEVLEVLGQGGMGIVYKAVDPGIGRQVAIKMMTGGFAENPDLLKRFQREAQSAGSLQHRNIVIIYELGTHENGNPYMAMEFLAGESLESMVSNRKRMSLVEKLEIMIQVLSGLQYAHSHGIVHRDIKPGNIMVLKDGTVKIVDFGIARISDNSMTKTGQIVGTINYMSPEQFNGHVVDGRSDIFSAGVMLYEFLTGTLPFDGNETPTVILKILNDPPPPLKDHLPNFPPELEDCVKRALAKDREERFATAEDFAFELSRIQEALKKEMVVEYVEMAKACYDKKEFTKAKDLLQQVLKADSKHTAAQDLMKQVQQQLSVQQRGEQIRQLRQAAEDALAQKSLDDAISYTEQALKIDKGNTELLQLQKMVQQAKQRRDQLEKTLRKAEDLKQDGELDAALRTAEEACALDPKDTNAKNVRDAIHAEIKKAQAQKELTALLDEARKEISDRHFSKALELIRKTEGVAPGATQASSLRNVLATAREHESARIAVDKALIDIEVSLYRDSMAAAQQKIDAANKKFPGEDAINHLAQQAKALREAAGLGDKTKVSERVNALVADENFEPAIAMLEHATKAAPDESLKTLLAQTKAKQDEVAKKAAAAAADAEQVFKTGKIDDAVAKLENAPASYARFASFLAVFEKARAEQDRLNTIEVAVIEARKQAEKGDITGAHSKAKLLLQQNPSSQQVQGLIKELDARRATVAKEQVEKAIKDAKALVLARQMSAANRTLQGVAQFVPQAPPDIQKAYAALQKEISASSTGQQQINADMNATMVVGSAGRASGAGAAPAPAAQRTMVSAPPIPQAKPFPVKAVLGGVLAIAAVVGGWFGYQQLTAPPPITTYIEVTATPWAMVVSVDSTDGKLHYPVNQETPVRVPVPAGSFTVTLQSPSGETVTEKAENLAATSPGIINRGFEAVDPDEIVKSSN